MFILASLTDTATAVNTADPFALAVLAMCSMLVALFIYMRKQIGRK